MISTLPTAGLKQIVHLILEQTKYLRKFPSIFHFDKIETARLTYAHHCCLFQNPARQDPIKYEAYKQFIKNQSIICAQEQSKVSTVNFDDSTITVDPFNFYDFGSNIYRRRLLDAPKFGKIDESIPPTGRPSVGDEYGLFIGDKNITKSRMFTCGDLVIDYRNVTCTPQPDAFNPCEDVMGYVWLRVIVWFVLLSAIVGNVIVMFVICTSRHKMDVNKFLVCNLAFADFLMGLYLLLLASIDIRTLGEYFNFAIHWQTEGGCKAAGFLTIFSSQLSVFTLTVITLERWYAINNAIHLRKRLKLRQAVGFMCIGWLFAFIMALLPMVGISGYGNVSICLPMKVTNKWDLSYIILLLILNWMSFAVILACYVSMYYKVRSNSSVVNSAASKSDYTIAKRMALLVFTNVICFFPITFFGLTASAGFPLISITNSKILLVLFYPFNSCANPFLYAILTKQFRKDMFFMLSHHGLCTKQANKYKSTMSKSLSHASRNNMMLQYISPMSEEPHGFAEYRNILTPTGNQEDMSPNNIRDTNKKPQLTENGKESLCNDVKEEESIDVRKSCNIHESSFSSEGCEQIRKGKHLCPTEPQYTDMADTVRSASDYAIKYSPEEDHAANKLQKLSSQNSNTASETDMSYISSELSRIIHQDSWPDKEEEDNDDILQKTTENTTCLDVDLGYHSGRGISPNYRTQISGEDEYAKLLKNKDSKKSLKIGDDRCLMDDEIAD